MYMKHNQNKIRWLLFVHRNGLVYLISNTRIVKSNITYCVFYWPVDLLRCGM